MAASQIKKAVLGSLPSQVIALNKTEDFESVLLKARKKLKYMSVLLTAKADIPPIYKALSVHLQSSMTFAVVLQAQKDQSERGELVTLIQGQTGLENVPLLVVFPYNVQETPIVYTGDVKDKSAVIDFLKAYASQSIQNDTEETEDEPKFVELDPAHWDNIVLSELSAWVVVSVDNALTNPNDAESKQFEERMQQFTKECSAIGFIRVGLIDCAKYKDSISNCERLNLTPEIKSVKIRVIGYGSKEEKEEKMCAHPLLNSLLFIYSHFFYY